MARKIYNKSIPKPHLTTGDIAHYCHTTVMQVNRWIKNDALNAYRNPGGQYRISKDEFKNFLERNGMPVIEDFFYATTEKKILVADDDESVVGAIKHILKSYDKSFNVEVAYDGFDTLIKAGDFKPDVLIVDIRMPKVDGLEVCRRLREHNAVTAGIKILAITGHSEAYNRDTVLGSGADEYLLKPFDSRSILMHMEKLLK